MSKDVFILGAGFSKAISDHMPTLIELAALLKPKLDNLFQGIERKPIELFNNIESLLSFLADDCPWLAQSQIYRNRSIFLELSKDIAQEIESKQSKVKKEEMPDWFEKLIKKWHEVRTDVISFNYDLLIEIAATLQGEVQSSGPAGNTGLVTQDDLYPVTITPVLLRKSGTWGRDPVATFKLYKLHGSINWFYSGSDDFYGEQIFTNEVLNGRWDVAPSSESYNALQDKVPLIIPPTLNKSTFFKNETVRAMWRIAGLAMRKANNVFCIGYSFPETDMMIKYFVNTSAPDEKFNFYWINKEDHTGKLENILPRSCKINKKYCCKQNAVSDFVVDYVNGAI